MSYKNRQTEEFEYVPATRYGMPGLIAIPIDEIAYVFGYNLNHGYVTGLLLKGGQLHGSTGINPTMGDLNGEELW